MLYLAICITNQHNFFNSQTFFILLSFLNYLHYLSLFVLKNYVRRILGIFLYISTKKLDARKGRKPVKRFKIYIHTSWEFDGFMHSWRNNQLMLTKVKKTSHIQQNYYEGSKSKYLYTPKGYSDISVRPVGRPVSLWQAAD